MLVSALLFISVAAGRPDEAVREITKGSALLRSCQAEIRLMELPSISQATQPDLIEGTFCVGFVNGYTGNLNGTNAPICTKGANMGEVVRAYVDFMIKNPTLLEEDRRVGFRQALQAKFPCPVVSHPRLNDSPAGEARSI